MCRNHPKYENSDGMPSSILQRMHRKIHAPRVGTATYAIYLIDLVGLWCTSSNKFELVSLQYQ